MPQINGRQRVVITNIEPQVNNGSYPVKAIVEQPVCISASVFCDGHDILGAQVSIKHEREKLWQQLPLQPKGNDHWEAGFIPARTGRYTFQITGWIDHFATWRHAFIKKKTGGQATDTDLEIGIGLLDEVIGRSKKQDKTKLMNWRSRIVNATEETDIIGILEEEEWTTITAQYPDMSLATRHPKVLVLDVLIAKAGFSSWYELFPRSTASEPGRHGTLNDVKLLLPRIAAMGFDVLYLPPIHPIGKVKRKGKNNALIAGSEDPGSPWAIGSDEGGHKAIHPQLGTLKDFKSLVSAAARLHIDIAMDIAFQCAPDHPYVKEHPEWFQWRPDGTVQYAENPPKKYEDILPFHFECDQWKELWLELKSIVDYWIAQGVRIFRIDNPHTKPFPFWEWLIKTVRNDHPDIIFLAEAFTRPRLMEQLAMSGFTQSYTYFAWRNSKRELMQYMKDLTQTDMRHYFQPNFWPNTPDILTPTLVDGGENAHISRLILAGTLSSSYGVYGPVYELGVHDPTPGKEEYYNNEKYEIAHWDWNRYTRTKEIMARLNRIRKENPALHNSNNIVFAETTSEAIVCYCKVDKQHHNSLIIAVNLDPYQQQSTIAELPLDYLGLETGKPFKVRDLLSGDIYEWSGSRQYIALQPSDMPAHIFKVER